jgi:hypothetical protein
MGYLNKATITVDAILTNRGRQLLAEGGATDSRLIITKFAVADDEIDYGLYYNNHPNGSSYDGSIIENMPVLEATPDEQQIMRYKLVSLDSVDATTGFGTNNPFVVNGVVVIPQIGGLDESVSLTANSTSVTKTPSTTPSNATSPAESYTLLVADATFIDILRGTGNNASAPLNTLNTTTVGGVSVPRTVNSNGSITLQFAAGEVITFRAKPNSSTGVETGTTTATIFGNKTGATKSFTIKVS